MGPFVVILGCSQPHGLGLRLDKLLKSPVFTVHLSVSLLFVFVV